MSTTQNNSHGEIQNLSKPRIFHLEIIITTADGSLILEKNRRCVSDFSTKIEESIASELAYEALQILQGGSRLHV